MHFKFALIIVCLLDGSHFRKHGRRHFKKTEDLSLAPKQLQKLKANQNPWEEGLYDDAIYIKGRAGIKNESYRWYNREIPYEMHNDFTKNEKKIIRNALNVIANQTCIKPRPRQKIDRESILFVKKPGGCFSYVGSYHHLQQEIYLDPKKGCVSEGTIKHEFLHTLGLYHEQSATDRDKYVTIFWENIRKGAEDNFKISSRASSNFGLGYDYNSIMHYSSYAFSKNGLETIKAKQPGVNLTKKYNLSKKDIEIINIMYNCTQVSKF